MKPLPLKGSKKCSICGISGHNSRTCPEKQKREFELKSAQQILKCSVPAVAVVKGAENNVSDDQQLNASSVPSSSPSENSNFCCPFCKKDVADSRNGRKLLFCTNCKAVDTQSLFSSSLADANSDTLEKLQKLHPQENFKCSKPEVCPFWIENPITAIEVLKAIQKLPKGKAAGPSGISFDLLKIACSSAPEIADDLAHYFQQLIVLKINPPFELLAARLIALVKPGNGIKPDGIRPIAVGESLSRLLASIVFDRVKDKASTFLNPHQFGIKTIDGASVAAIASNTFFNAEENNFIFNLDFKNAFNSVKREAIFEVIKSDFPELSSFFYHFYGKESDLIFNSFGLKSSSGVKQGDPLGPLLFCLAIHKTLNIIKQKYPSIKIVAYMDDISLIGSFDLLELVAQEIADSYENIGLHLNASKCLLIGSSAQDLVINDSIVPFTNYSSDAFKFLGCWLGNVPQIQNELQVILEKMKIELESISSLDIEKHIKFFMLKICYTGRITHILRSCAPSIALDFCRSFNSLRTEFFADLLDVEPGMLKSHLFSSANLGGIGFTKSSILCQSAFLGGGKNFIYEFSRRFPDDSHLLVPNCSPYLYELSCELEKLPPQIWTKCFPQSIQEIPNRSLFNLQFCCKKLQQKLSKIFESLDFDVSLGLAKKKNPAFANLLQDMCDSTSSALVTTIPQVYGTLLSDSAWTLNMRFRSFIWPDNLPHNLICKCSQIKLPDIAMDNHSEIFSAKKTLLRWFLNLSTHCFFNDNLMQFALHVLKSRLNYFDLPFPTVPDETVIDVLNELSPRWREIVIRENGFYLLDTLVFAKKKFKIPYGHGLGNLVYKMINEKKIKLHQEFSHILPIDCLATSPLIENSIQYGLSDCILCLKLFVLFQKNKYILSSYKTIRATVISIVKHSNVMKLRETAVKFQQLRIHTTCCLKLYLPSCFERNFIPPRISAQ
ncbi:hypothetical protein P9112_000776 [Eukaryota sp. TZLM1-RC]